MTHEDSVFEEWVREARSADILAAYEKRGHAKLKKSGAEYIGPCPVCGGRDRFSINTTKKIFHCRGSGSGGDVIAMLRYLDGSDFLAACEDLSGRAPPRGEGQRLAPEELAHRAEERRTAEAKRQGEADAYRQRERLRLYHMWRSAVRVPGTPVESYLALRGVHAPASAALRYLPETRLYASGAKGAAIVHVGPAMLAAIIGPNGCFGGLHITWIDLTQPDGKALVADPETGELLPAKKVRGSKAGGRIELARVEAPTRLVIGEGIETVLSVYVDMFEQGRDLSRTAFWSSVDLGNLGGRATGTVPHPTHWNVDRLGRARVQNVPGPDPDFDSAGIPIPDSVVDIVTLGDSDSDRFLTEMAHRRAARRWQAKGRIIRAAFPPPGKDFNNLRRERLA